MLMLLEHLTSSFGVMDLVMVHESMSAVAAVAVGLLFTLGRQLLGALVNAVMTILDAVEDLTTGWTSPPLPAKLPGPRGIPFLGFLPFLGQRPYETLAKVAKRYGGRAFRLAAGCRRFVVVSRIETLRHLASRYANQLRGKPRTFTTDQMTLGAHNDMLQRWKRRRAYTDAGLRQIQNCTHGSILHDEIDQLLDYLTSLSTSGRSSDVRHDVTLTAARVMYRLSYGSSPNQSALESLCHIVHTLPSYTTTIGSLSWFDVLPLWRKLRRSALNCFIAFNRYASAFCQREKTRHREEISVANLDSDRSATNLFEFFMHKLARMSNSDRQRYSMTDDVLLDGLEDIIRAGTESSSLLIQWFLYYIAAFPQVQKRMQEEVDNLATTIGDELTVEDLRSLPYCRAAFAEACRFCCLNPYLKREVTDDIELDGVRLPRGTVLLFNNWAINNDPHYWKRPEVFDPERFLTADGEFDEEKMTQFVPFGFGKRRCIGIETGRALCLLTAASVVRRFSVDLDGDKVDFSPVLGIGLAPKPYQLNFVSRSVV